MARRKREPQADTERRLAPEGVQYLERKAQPWTAKKRQRWARAASGRRAKRGQLSVMMDRDTLERWRAYVSDVVASREEGDETSGAMMIEELIDRELRRKKR